MDNKQVENEQNENYLVTVLDSILVHIYSVFDIEERLSSNTDPELERSIENIEILKKRASNKQFNKIFSDLELYVYSFQKLKELVPKNKRLANISKLFSIISREKNLKKNTIDIEKILTSEQYRTNFILLFDDGEKVDFTSELNKASEELEMMFERKLDRFKNTINAYEENLYPKINNSTEKVYNDFNDYLNNSLDKVRKEEKNNFERFKVSVDKEIDSIAERIKIEVEKFELKRKTMDDLLEAVGIAKDGDITITQANKEEKTANSLRFWGLIVLGSSILLLFLFFAEYIGLAFWKESTKTLNDITPIAFVFRFMTVFLVSSPAIYLLKESSSHRAKENLYRQRGTQLLSIQGYLADLSEDERAKLKHSLADNFFSFHNGKVDTSNVPDFLKSMQEAAAIAKTFNSVTTNPRKEYTHSDNVEKVKV